MLGQRDGDAVVDPLDGVDGNGDLLTAPEMALLQQHVGDVSPGRIDDEPLHLADLTVARMHGLASANADLTRRERVPGLDRTGQRERWVGAALQAEVGPVVGLVGGVGVVAAATGQEVHLLGRGQLVEFGKGVVQAEVAVAGLNHVEGTRRPSPLRCSGSTTRWVSSRATGSMTTLLTAAARPVAAGGGGPDRERCVCHTGLLYRARPYRGTGARPGPFDRPGCHQPRKSTSQRSTTSSPSTRYRNS